jgi:MFS family permease
VTDTSGGLWRSDRRALTIGLVTTITLVAFEALAISTVMPIVARELGGLELYGWVFSAFFLGALIGIVMVGGAIDRGGLAIPFAIGIGLFALGLLAGGLAPSMLILVAARFLQGLGAGTLQPIAYVAIGRTLPERLRPRMFATLSTAWVVPGVIGPAIAGAIGESLGWRFVFLGLLPLIAIAGMVTLQALRHVAAAPPLDDEGSVAARSARRGRLPLALAVTFGIGLFTLGLTAAQPLPTIGLVVVGAVISLYSIRRLTPAGTLTARPILPAAVLIRGIQTCAFFGVDAFVALALIDWRGVSAIQAGVALTAATIAWTAGAWIQARGANRWPTYRFVQVGFALILAGLAGMLLALVPEISWLVALPAFGVAGLGMGLSYSPITLIVLREASVTTQGFATSALSLTDTVGATLGTGISGAIVAASLRSTGAPAAGLAVAFLVAIAIGAFGLALTGRLRPRSAQAPTFAALASSSPP